MGNRKKKRIRISKDGLVGIVSDMVKAELVVEDKGRMFDYRGLVPMGLAL